MKKIGFEIDLVSLIYHTSLTGRLFHTLSYFLKRELSHCQSVLDLGCGRDSPLKFCQVPYSLGVDVFEPSLKVSQKKQIHTKYNCADILKVNFGKKSFDAVVMIDVLEHLKKEDGEKILAKAEKWARKKVIISTPNGYLPQGKTERNPYQLHRSGWLPAELTQRGYRSYGLGGWNLLRKPNKSPKEGLLGTVKYSPKIFWLAISLISQLFFYYFPDHAYGVICVKVIHE